MHGIMRTIAEIASTLPGIPRIPGTRIPGTRIPGTRIPGTRIGGPLTAAPPRRLIRIRLVTAHVPVRRPGVLTRHRWPAQILLVRRPSAAHEPSHP
jgi:hypothetical protein